MNRYKFFHVILILALFACLAAGCVSKENVLIYTTKDGAVSYTLNLSEKAGTFVLIEEKVGETKEYRGTYVYKDGVAVLHCEEFGYRSAALQGNGFIFVTNEEGLEEIVPPCEHEWGNSVYTPGNCITYGSTEYTCLKCGEKKTVKDGNYGAHVLDNGKHVDGATCTDYGYTLYTCKICRKYTEKKEDTELTESHVYEATGKTLDEGCDKIIKVQYRCTRCQHETYLADDNRTIGAHKYDDKGVCTVCKHLKNGLPSQHEDKDNDGRCDTCGVKRTVLCGFVDSPDGYEEDGKIYMGVYPQMGAVQSAKDIKATGLYDAALDCWYYGKETYVIRKAGVQSETITLLGGAQTVEQGKEYAFLLQPLAFVKQGDKYICDVIIDAGAFQKESAQISSGVSNAWQDSTLRVYTETTILTRTGLSQIAETIDLATVEDVTEPALKAVTDYALTGGIGYVAQGDERYGRWFLKTPAESSDQVKCVGYGGTVENAAVTAIRGVVPIVTLRQGE